ncbi:MAG: hypothetical protein EXR77_18360 [Myxococcales bacterium]|nr:hypothetical protein [Myxococcales bacterium]
MSAPVRLQVLPSTESLQALRRQLVDELQQKGVAGTTFTGNAALRLAEMPPLAADRSPLAWSELTGRLIEVTAPYSQPVATAAAWAGASWAAALIAQVQRLGETAAWVLCAELPQSAVWKMPHAPDLHACGVDVRALPLVRARTPAQVLQAADVLLRSGAFGLVIADWPAQAPPPRDGPLGRLLGLCQRHEAAVVFLTAPFMDTGAVPARSAENPARSAENPAAGGQLGSLISLRLEVWRQMTARSLSPSSPPASAIQSYTIQKSTIYASTIQEYSPFVLHVAVRKDKKRGLGWQEQAPRRGPAGIV